MKAAETAIEPIRAISEGTIICGGTSLTSEVGRRMATVFRRPGVTPEVVGMFVDFINVHQHLADSCIDESGYINREGQQCIEEAEGLECGLRNFLMSAIAHGHCADPQACAALLYEMDEEEKEA